jgi:hypothetical protein
MRLPRFNNKDPKPFERHLAEMAIVAFILVMVLIAILLAIKFR